MAGSRTSLRRGHSVVAMAECVTSSASVTVIANMSSLAVGDRLTSSRWARVLTERTRRRSQNGTGRGHSPGVRLARSCGAAHPGGRGDPPGGRITLGY
jgi:hypothetical protein